VLGFESESYAEIHKSLDYLGSTLQPSCSRDFAVLTMKTLTRNLEESLRLFFDALIRPVFPAEEVQREIWLIKGRIRSEKDDPGKVAEKAFRETLFLNSPYEHPVKGREESVSSMKRESLSAFHRRYYRPNNAFLVVVGDISPEEIREKIVPKLETWKEEEVAEPSLNSVVEKRSSTVETHRSISQANICLGHEGISRKCPDYYAVSVMDHILGGGMGSRLFKRIRIDEGLAYSVSSEFSAQKRGGTFQVRLQTKNESAARAVGLVLREMEKMGKESVSEEELKTAKKYLVGSFPLRLTTQDALASFLLYMAYYELGLNYPQRYASLIHAVSKGRVLEAGKRYLHPERVILSVVGDTEKIEEYHGAKNKYFEPVSTGVLAE
jgi:zinc protease